MAEESNGRYRSSSFMGAHGKITCEADAGRCGEGWGRRVSYRLMAEDGNHWGRSTRLLTHHSLSILVEATL